ncbi:hypothetical protein HDA32_000676 [Spinactinospora alkalitolerans]|uniref:Lipoprotein n=1 Tax=Spinactinospora alkalitolerans TaxID=687207 RepID=A0A852TMM5_9ACTN|nr:SurA N-terminal domain-containing protein [Spinactinospora alkalitolerans]NYE45556.1 hypothetical protein [Spinactinospora alkalitolerans]
MRLSSPHRTTLLTLASGAALVALTGCGISQAGAAAVVGGDRISTEQIQTDIASVEELVAEQLGQEVPDSNRAQLASEIVANRVRFTLFEQIAEDRGIDIGRAAVDAEVEDQGGIEPLAQQAGTAQARDLAMFLLVQEELVDADAEEVEALSGQIREQQREAYREQLEAQGLQGGELEEQLEAGMAQVEPQIRETAQGQYLGAQVEPYIERTEIEVSPRYGTIDPATLQVFPGVSALSAPETRPGAQVPPGMGG